MNTLRPKHCCAFTLIELLVVIGVIGILLAITVPAVFEGMARAKQAAGLMDLRQIGVGFMAYAVDNNSRMPYSYDPATSQTYAHFIQDYLPEDITNAKRNIFVSPSADKEITAGDFTIAITYSAHPLICHEKSLTDLRVPTYDIVRPSQVILLADAPQIPWNNNQSTANFWNPWQIFSPESVPDLSQPIPVGPDADTGEAQGWFRYRNNGSMNALMADGHAQSFKKGSVTFANLLWDR